MSNTITHERQVAKTPEAVFYQALRQEFNFSLRLAQDVLNAAEELLIEQASPERVRPGQVRRVVASLAVWAAAGGNGQAGDHPDGGRRARRR